MDGSEQSYQRHNNRQQHFLYWGCGLFTNFYTVTCWANCVLNGVTAVSHHYVNKTGYIDWNVNVCGG